MWGAPPGWDRSLPNPLNVMIICAFRAAIGGARPHGPSDDSKVREGDGTAARTLALKLQVFDVRDVADLDGALSLSRSNFKHPLEDVVVASMFGQMARPRPVEHQRLRMARRSSRTSVRSRSL